MRPEYKIFQPFSIDEEVEPHINFKKSKPEMPEKVTVRTIKKGESSSGWLVTIKELKKNLYEGDSDYDEYCSSWFFKLKK